MLQVGIMSSSDGVNRNQESVIFLSYNNQTLTKMRQGAGYKQAKGGSVSVDGPWNSLPKDAEFVMDLRVDSTGSCKWRFREYRGKRNSLYNLFLYSSFDNHFNLWIAYSNTLLTAELTPKLYQVAQSLVQVSPEHLQEWRFPSFPGELWQLLNHPLGGSMCVAFPHI